MLSASTVDESASLVLPAKTADDGADKPTSESPSMGLIEIGWILAGSFDQEDLRAIREARRLLLASLAIQLPDFTWRIPVVQRPELVKELDVEPTELLDDAVVERDRRRWDFGVVITSADLIAHYQSDASFFLSRVLQSAVISTSRLDPKAWDAHSDDDERVQTMTKHLVRLMMHAITHWNGLQQAALNDNLEPIGFDPNQRHQLETNLRQLADSRLEEDTPSIQPLTFTCRALWRNRRDLTRAIWEARPWQFPLRLSRLTTAAASAMLLMLLTAEVWDLGMSQTLPMILFMAMVVIIATTIYILKRQRLLVHRSGHPLTEQIVLTNAATCCIVLSGMAATFFCLFAVALLLSTAMFTNAVASAWAATVPGSILLTHYISLAGFISSLSITVGALGASFEQHHYFRHVTFVDEEL